MQLGFRQMFSSADGLVVAPQKVQNLALGRNGFPQNLQVFILVAPFYRLGRCCNTVLQGEDTIIIDRNQQNRRLQGRGR